MKQLKLLDFIKNNSNWEELLQKEPYYLKIKRDRKFIIFNYNQIMSDFSNPIDNIYLNKDFCEFEISSQDFAGYKLPIGGGYLRMLPWWFNQMQLKKYADTGKFFVMYIHPFELSSKKVPYVSDAGLSNRIRSTLGRRNVAKRVDKVIRFMKAQGYEFVTYRELREKVLLVKPERDLSGNKLVENANSNHGDMIVSNQILPISR